MSPFNISLKLVWWYWILLTFACLKSFFISPSILNEILARYGKLGCLFLPFCTLTISHHFFSGLQSFCWKISCQVHGVSLDVTCCFSLAVFNILSLCLVFVSLISMCLGIFLLGFILYGTLCASWTWLTISFSVLGEFSTIISSRIFSYPFSFSSSSGSLIIQMVLHLILSQRSLRLS